MKFGNISKGDYEELIHLTSTLSEYLYSDYFIKEGSDMGQLFPDALILPEDDLRYEIQTLNDALAEKDSVIAEKDSALPVMAAELTDLRAKLTQLETD